VDNTAEQLQSATKPATNAVANAFTGAFDTVSSAATNFWNWLAVHSLWPNMLGRMSGVTRDKPLDISRTFQSTFQIVREATTGFFTSLVTVTGDAMMQIGQMIEAELLRLQQDFTAILCQA